MVGNVSIFNAINATAYKYGIFNQTANGPVHAGNIVPGSVPSFQNILLPIWQTAPLAESNAMFLELHQTPHNSRQSVESVMAAGYGGTGAFTGVFQLVEDKIYRPSTVLFSGVYSLSRTRELLGLTGIAFSWDTLLHNALPDNLKRIDCVLSTKSTVLTMAVEEGMVTVVGKGDFNEPIMTSYAKDVILDASGGHSLSDFAITVYPSLDLYNQYITQQPVNLGVVAGLTVFVVLFLSYSFRIYTVRNREKSRIEKERVVRSKVKLLKYMEEVKRSLNDARKAEEEKMREQQLKMELQENITNSAHDIKSPTTALSLAVDSLLDVLDNSKPITEAGRRRVVETLHGMVHTIAALIMTINRSVVCPFPLVSISS